MLTRSKFDLILFFNFFSLLPLILNVDGTQTVPRAMAVPWYSNVPCIPYKINSLMLWVGAVGVVIKNDAAVLQVCRGSDGGGVLVGLAVGRPHGGSLQQ